MGISSFTDFAAPVVARNITVNGKEETVHVKEISADESAKIFDVFDENQKLDKKRSKGLRNRVIATCIVNEDGSPIGDEEAAGKIPVRLANKLQKIAMEVNALGQAAVEAAAKNS